MDPYENPTLDAEKRIDDLLSQMTVEEKTAQMVTLYGFPRVLKDELPTETWKKEMWHDGIGNIDEHMNGNTGWTNNLPAPHYALPYSLHARALNEVQRFFIEDTRLGIPADFTNEGIRGVMHSKATSFPSEIAVASCWDASLVREIGRVTGSEGRALGYTNIYSPVLDLNRDPRWGRTTEAYSEDPYLTSVLGEQQVLGIQEQGLVSTLKHFAVYSIPKGGRDGEARTDPQTSWRDVQTIFLAPFRRAIAQAGARGVMASYNDYDGIPIEANGLFLTKILRQEWGFRGYVVSDSAAVEFVHTKHRVAPTPSDAIRQSVEAGLNVRTNFTPPQDYVLPLRQLVKDGKLPMSIIDSRVRDVLRVKFWLGLFDSPYRLDPTEADRIVRSPAHLAVAARAARESIVLLKNEATLLPLRKNLGKVLVTGPLADNPHGWWSRYAPQDLEFVSVLAGLRKKLGPAVEVRYQQGCTTVDKAFPESDVLKEPPSEEVLQGIAAAVAASKDVDVIIAVLGETDDISRESASRINLNLPGYQEELLEALHATGKPLVLVLSNGRPLTLNWAAKHVQAIVELWFPGEEGGDAIADVLFGDVNPSGRLPVTIPRSVGQLPLNFPAHPGSQARDMGQVTGPLYPFGYGLSYTRFSYANLKISPEKAGLGSNFKVTCEVSNSGEREGDEVVQLYLRDDYSTVITFDKVLRGFTRVTLKPGEKCTVEFVLKPEDLQLYDRNEHWTVEPGRFTVQIGRSSETVALEGQFVVGEGPALEEAPIKPEHTDPR
jgi:beta-glucosidase